MELRLKSTASATSVPRPNIFLGLGSNLGDRFHFLQRALELLDAVPGVNLTQISSIFETEPVGLAEQDSFLNIVAEVATTLSPQDLLTATQRIEAELGRVRRHRWGPRVIDIDILCWNDSIIDDALLQVPHLQLCHRRFVLQPLREIASDFRVPPDGLPVAELLEKCADTSAVQLWRSSLSLPSAKSKDQPCDLST